MGKVVYGEAAAPFNFDNTKYGFTIQWDVERKPDDVLQLAEVYTEESELSTGVSVFDRAQTIGRERCAGQHHAEYLCDNQGEIPKQWRRYLLVFAGTSWGTGVNRQVCYLGWGGKDWSIGWRYDSGWGGGSKIVLIK